MATTFTILESDKSHRFWPDSFTVLRHLLLVIENGVETPLEKSRTSPILWSQMMRVEAGIRTGLVDIYSCTVLLSRDGSR